jgi:putative transposase
MLHRRRRPVSRSRRMDETYIRVHGQWRYLYRAVDKTGQSVDFLLTMQRDQEVALRFLKKALSLHGLPETIIIDGGEDSAADIRHYNVSHGTAMVIRQVRYLSNSVEQDHRAVRRIVRSTTSPLSSSPTTGYICLAMAIPSTQISGMGLGSCAGE